MLKKELTLPGARVRINDVIKDGLPKMYGGGEILDCVSVWLNGVGPLVSKSVHLHSGDEVTIIKKPGRREGINLVTVELDNGQTGVIYWCELRASATHI